MKDALALRAGPLVDASLALVRSTETRPIVDHSIRSFLFARLLAEHEGCMNDAAYDEELLFAATVMHDLGLGEQARGQAIALHSSIGLAERRGLLTYLTYEGDFIDVGRLADVVPDRMQ